MKIKSILVALSLITMVGCDTFFPPMKFKVISNGKVFITYSDSGGTSQWEGGTQEFEREMLTDEFYYLSAQSQDGKGCVVEAYVGKELVKSARATGYGVASVSGSY